MPPCRTDGTLRRRRTIRHVIGGALIAATLTGCGWVGSWFEDEDEKPQAVPVLDVQPGMCFSPPGDIQAELESISQVRCDQPHTQEVYAIRAYTPPTAGNDSFPGEGALTTFANGACAEAFTDYVGISYLDSSLWYTFLLPSARGWEQNSDRSIVCVATTTGAQLTASVAGSKL